MEFLKNFLIVTIMFLVVSCTPHKETPVTKNQSSYNSIVSYEVEGEGEDYFEARNDAINKGIVKGIIEIIGKEEFDKYRIKIEEKILKTKKIVNEVSEFNSTSIFDRDGKKVVTAIIKINKNLLKKYIDSVDFSYSESYPSKADKTSTESFKNNEEGKFQVGEFSISKDSSLVAASFLVFVPNEKISSFDEDYKVFLEMINSKISEYGLEYIDFKRVMDLSKKFSVIYEEKSGTSMSLAQMLAQEVKADVYIEIDLDIIPAMISGNYVELGVKGSIKAYDSSTGRGLGLVTFSETEKSTKGFSKAKLDLMEKVANYSVPKLLKSIQDYFSRGAKISVKIIGFRSISEEKSFSTILDSLPGIVDKKRKSISGNVSEYEVSYKGGVTSFVEDLINTLSGDPNYSKSLIDQSGNSVIINIK